MTLFSRRLLLGFTGAFIFASVLATTPSLAQKKAGNPRVAMDIETLPKKKVVTLEIELLTKAAPKTAAHFLELAKKKFFDGILFHRWVEGFVIQGGDPKSKTVEGAKIRDLPWQQVGEQFGLGEGGSGKNVPLEANAAHTRGTVGLARSSAPDSGDSQFFFNLKDNNNLDSGYCVFGKIVKGIENLDGLRQGDKIKGIRLLGEKKPKK